MQLKKTMSQLHQFNKTNKLRKKLTKNYIEFI